MCVVGASLVAPFRRVNIYAEEELWWIVSRRLYAPYPSSKSCAVVIARSFAWLTHSPPQLLPLLLRRQLHLLLLATERTPASLMLAMLLLPSSYLSSTSLLGQRCASRSRRPALLGPSVSRRCSSSSRRPALPVMKALPPEVVAAYEQRFGELGAAPAALPKGQVVPIVS